MEIKTYQQVNRQDVSSHFSISRMEDSYTARIGKENNPHRHNYFTALLVKKAEGKHFIDFKEYKLTGNQVFFVSPGQVHQVIENKQSFGYIITFSTQFLVNNNIPLSFIEDLNLFSDYGDASPMEMTANQMEELVKYGEDIVKYKESVMKFKEQAIASSVKLFLIYCNNICSKPMDNTQLVQAGHSILKEFKSTVENNYKEWHSSSQYASYLNITPDHLNRTIKSLIGKTAKEYIQTRILIEAKRLLYFSDISAKEIGFQLGFSEASNFSAFFKKNTKLSPSDFRKRR